MSKRFNRTEEVRLALTGQFRDYTIDRVAKINLYWIALEKNPDDSETAETLLRELHGLKGEAHIMGFADVSLISHRAEELLIIARESSLPLDSVGDLILRATDAIASLVQRRENDERPDVNELLQRFDELIARKTPAKRCSVQEPSKPFVETAEPTKTLHGWQGGGSDERSVRVELDCLGTFAEAAAEAVIAHTRYEHVLEHLRELCGDALDNLAEVTVEAPSDSGFSAARSAEKLVEARRILATMQGVAAGLAEQLYEGNVLAREVEHQSRGLRVVPIVTLFGRYARAARELAADDDKRIVVAIEDNGIRVDHAVVDKLAEPILHLIRNSVDHGIETPDERRRANKSEEGCITLGAQMRRGSILVTVADDGRGINYHRVRERAQELGWLTDEDSYPDHVLNFIFRPGFTTRSVASQVSGRGVGLDVVKRNVEMLGGVVRAESCPGKETRFELQVPANITLSRVLVLRCGQEQYGLPSRAVECVEAVAPSAIENIHDRQVIRRGGTVFPLVALAPLLGLDEIEPTEEGELRVVVVKHEKSAVAFVVSGWVDDAEVVVKSHPLLDSTRIITGATVLQDGEVALVLNPSELIARALGEVPQIALPSARRERPSEKRRRILLVEDQAITRAVIARMLRALEHDVLEASDGEQALQVLEREDDIDLVLTDIDMPVMNGIELIRQIRTQRVRKNLPIIVLSTHGTDADKRRALDAGADDYLVKTEFSELSLRAVMDRRLGS